MKLTIKTDKVKQAKESSRIICKLPKNKIKPSGKLYSRQESKKISDGFLLCA